MRLALKVTPGAPGDAVFGWLGDTLKLRVSAAPERGKANAAVERFLAQTLGIPVTDVRIVAGASSPRKIVEIEGLSEAEVCRRLGKGAPPTS